MVIMLFFILHKSNVTNSCMFFRPIYHVKFQDSTSEVCMAIMLTLVIVQNYKL